MVGNVADRKHQRAVYEDADPLSGAVRVVDGVDDRGLAALLRSSRSSRRRLIAAWPSMGGVNSAQRWTAADLHMALGQLVGDRDRLVHVGAEGGHAALIGEGDDDRGRRLDPPRWSTGSAPEGAE